MSDILVFLGWKQQDPGILTVFLMIGLMILFYFAEKSEEFRLLWQTQTRSSVFSSAGTSNSVQLSFMWASQAKTSKSWHPYMEGLTREM